MAAPFVSGFSPILNALLLQFADVVVSVARKMDAALWPALFDATGPPDALAEGLLEAGQPVSAACCLLIVDRLQGAPRAQALALRTIQAGPCVS